MHIARLAVHIIGYIFTEDTVVLYIVRLAVHIIGYIFTGDTL